MRVDDVHGAKTLNGFPYAVSHIFSRQSTLLSGTNLPHTHDSPPRFSYLGNHQIKCLWSTDYFSGKLAGNARKPHFFAPSAKNCPLILWNMEPKCMQSWELSWILTVLTGIILVYGGNRGTPKSSILDWDFPENSYWGTPHFRKLPYYRSRPLPLSGVRSVGRFQATPAVELEVFTVGDLILVRKRPRRKWIGLRENHRNPWVFTIKKKGVPVNKLSHQFCEIWDFTRKHGDLAWFNQWLAWI